MEFNQLTLQMTSGILENSIAARNSRPVNIFSLISEAHPQLVECVLLTHVSCNVELITLILA